MLYVQNHLHFTPWNLDRVYPRHRNRLCRQLLWFSFLKYPPKPPHQKHNRNLETVFAAPQWALGFNWKTPYVQHFCHTHITLANTGLLMATSFRQSRGRGFNCLGFSNDSFLRYLLGTFWTKQEQIFIQGQLIISRTQRKGREGSPRFTSWSE